MMSLRLHNGKSIEVSDSHVIIGHRQWRVSDGLLKDLQQLYREITVYEVPAITQ